eukprot:TRINITY_DN334_c0_g4_i1.p1 TRINITY_DN334_c0_g4~~TRINITY_DN334_c0_g4_i1.p1  ORF type:complete len:533 (+),score=116.88 TRINITY_DN334_c0_g4_i1:94-1692(+)
MPIKHRMVVPDISFAELFTFRRVIFPDHVVWRRDTRVMLREVHASATVGTVPRAQRIRGILRALGRVVTLRWKGLSEQIANDCTPEVRPKVPIADVEAAAARFRPIAGTDPVLLRAAARVPVLCYAVLMSRRRPQRLLYSAEAARHHRRVLDWCSAMRSALAAPPTPLPGRRAIPAPAAAEPAPTPQAGAVAPAHFDRSQYRSSAFPGEDSVAQAPEELACHIVVFIETLAGKSRHANVVDLVRVTLLLYFVLGMFYLMLGMVPEPLRWARLATQAAWDAVWHPERAQDPEWLQKRLLDELWPCPEEGEDLAPPNAPAGFPERLVERAGGQIVARAVELRRPRDGSSFLVVPVPYRACEEAFWCCGRLLMGCDAVAIEGLSTGASEADISQEDFFPPRSPADPVVGVFDKFVPLFHLPPPRPCILGTSPKWYWNRLRPVLAVYAYRWARWNEEHAVRSLCPRSATYRCIGTALAPHNSRGLCQHLIDAGYSEVVRVADVVLFDAAAASAAVAASAPPLLKGRLGSRPAPERT